MILGLRDGLRATGRQRWGRIGDGCFSWNGSGEVERRYFGVGHIVEFIEDCRPGGVLYLLWGEPGCVSFGGCGGFGARGFGAGGFGARGGWTAGWQERSAAGAGSCDIPECFGGFSLSRRAHRAD